jgi:Tfp pilus assembly protein PilN
MYPLQLDFVMSARQQASGMLLLIVGAIAVCVVGYWRIDLLAKADIIETRVNRLEREAIGLAPVDTRLDDSVGQEIQRANEVIDQLALPWNRLFRAVESVAAGPVTLLGIAPDAKSGTVQISAETTDAEAMFRYVKRLEQQPDLANVYLVEHQRDKRGGPRPLRFVVTASWLATQTRR